MVRTPIELSDFNLFAEVLKSAVKIVDSAKILIGPQGLEIYGARDKIARCELASNCVTSKEPIEFCLESLAMFNKVVATVRDVHEGDYSELKFMFDSPFLRFESKKFKTKYGTCNEATIGKWVSKKVETPLEPVFEFTTTSDMIKRVNSHAFMFSDSKTVRVYVETKDDMETNAVFATLGNKETALNNEITTKLGLVTSGTLNPENAKPRKIILDLERLNLFNAVQAPDIKISLMNLNVLVSKSKILGKNGSWFDLTIYNTMLKS